MTTRAALHELVDELPPEIIDVATRSLDRMRNDPVLWAFLTAPLDDEPLEPEEAALLDRRRAAFLRGEYMTSAQVDALICDE